MPLRGRALLAQQAASLADASGGRFALGIGASSDRIVEGWNKMPFEKPLTADLGDGRLPARRSSPGERVDGFKLESAARPGGPDHRSRRCAARCCALAVEKGDGAFTNFLPLSGLPQVTEQLEAARPTASSCSAGSSASPGEREQVEPLARFMFSSYITVPVYENFYRWLGHGEKIDPMVEAWAAKDRQKAAELAPWELIEDMFIFGSPEEMKERLGAYVEGGITLPGADPDHDAGQARAS